MKVNDQVLADAANDSYANRLQSDVEKKIISTFPWMVGNTSCLVMRIMLRVGFTQPHIRM
ncbi:hypothetical protein C8F00_3301 [Xanthomonas vasicola]